MLRVRLGGGEKVEAGCLDERMLRLGVGEKVEAGCFEERMLRLEGRM